MKNSAIKKRIVVDWSLRLAVFIAAVGVLLGGFFLVRGYLDASRHRLFGASEVRGATPELGGALEGIFKVANTRLLKAPIELSLRCDWRGHSAGIHGGSGSDGTTTLWRQSQSVAINLAQSGVAFHFDLPADGLPTGRRPRPKTGVHPAGPGYIVWTLRAFSRRLGVNYLAEFEIPVRPGTVIRAVGAKTKPEPANHAAGALAQGVALVLGGSAPSQDELDDEAEARSRPEPDVPFASSRMPLQQRAAIDVDAPIGHHERCAARGKESRRGDSADSKSHYHHAFAG